MVDVRIARITTAIIVVTVEAIVLIQDVFALMAQSGGDDIEFGIGFGAVPACEITLPSIPERLICRNNDEAFLTLTADPLRRGDPRLLEPLATRSWGLRPLRLCLRLRSDFPNFHTRGTMPTLSVTQTPSPREPPSSRDCWSAIDTRPPPSRAGWPMQCRTCASSGKCPNRFGRDGIVTHVLQVVRHELIQQPNPTSLLAR